jgi:hypothetical protein
MVQMAMKRYPRGSIRSPKPKTTEATNPGLAALQVPATSATLLLPLRLNAQLALEVAPAAYKQVLLQNPKVQKSKVDMYSREPVLRRMLEI